MYRKHPIRWTDKGWNWGASTYYVGPILERITSRAVEIRDAEVRRRVELAVEALHNIQLIKEVHGDSPYDVLWNSTQLPSNAIGAMLRGEELPQDASVLDEYRQAVYDAFGKPGESD